MNIGWIKRWWFGDSEERAEKRYDVWMEGHRATGSAAKAFLLGSCYAKNFREACVKVITWKGMDDNNFNEEKLTYWGCKMFSNECDARENFG